MQLIQAILFDNKKWLTSEARKWLHSHGYKPIKKVHTTHNFHRYRLADPEQFKSFYTKKLSDGIELVIGVN